MTIDSDSILITPATAPIRGRIAPPGSKSLTNRALITAALAQGDSLLAGVLDSRDTQVMIDSLRRLGFALEHDTATAEVRLRGCAGRVPGRPEGVELWLENSGTSIRFLTALCTLGTGRYRLDGNQRMRERPIGDLVRALQGLGAEVCCEQDTDCPPVLVSRGGLPGGETRVAGNLSSQFLSALLMAAPCARDGVKIVVEGALVSQPYVEMTLGVMRSFGVDVRAANRSCFSVAPGVYRGTHYRIEPDASAASYFFAAAAITGGEVTVPGLSRNALQGDVDFVAVLEQMGCQVTWAADAITVRGGPLQGIDVDMNAISDTAQTLAAVAVFATGPTRIRHVEHMRHKETDRVAAVVAELRKLGITVEEFADGLEIVPGRPRPGTVATYDDHRMAMSFALLGLRAPGIRIADPACTAKTYPRFFDDLQALCEVRS